MAFRPPLNRSMRQLSKALFKQEHNISAARVFAAQNLSRVLLDLKKSKDVIPPMPAVNPMKALPPEWPASSGKCVLLRPEIKVEDRGTWSETISKLVSDGDIDLIPYKLLLDYNNWTMNEILFSVLPEELHDEIPSNFNHAGHLAQLNLLEEYLPYKHIIGQVLLDKNPGIQTVINKTKTLDEDEDEQNIYRTINYELLAGKDDLYVEAKEHNSLFRFDYSRVFWNSKLGTEHLRLCNKFQPGEAVCDVMAGVGPFAIPAGKKGVFVWANDLNPDCFSYLKSAITRNKVSQYVHAFCEDGHQFISSATSRLLRTHHEARIPIKMSRTKQIEQNVRKEDLYTSVPQPRIFSHYVMNLPSTAPEFLRNFRGIYAGSESLFKPKGGNSLPMIHCYCFATNWDRSPGATNESAKQQVCERLSEELGHEISLTDEELEIFDVRNVAPTKNQLRVTFRLPAEVAFHDDGRG